MTTTAPYGEWDSPISTEMLTAAVVGLAEPRLDGDDVYWLESRANEGGRVVLVRLSPGGGRADVTPPPFNVRSRVHEYGGGAYAVHDGTVVFANFADMCVYRIDRGAAAPVAITPPGPLRYADLVIDHHRDRVLAVREDHTRPDPVDVVNTLVALDLHGDNPDGGTVLVGGSDFVASPALSADGRTLAWITWEHPAMPWDATALWSSPLDVDGLPSTPTQVAGGPTESAVQPRFRGSELHLCSDRTGWWNLYRAESDGSLTELAPSDHDFATPQWVFGTDDSAFAGADRILVRWFDGGIARLGLLDAHGASTQLDIGAVAVDALRTTTDGTTAVVIAGFADHATAIVRIDLASGTTEVLRSSTDVDLDPAGLSIAEPIEWASAGGETTYGFYYPPRNADVTGPADRLPPLLVMSHGGPTSATSPALSLRLQYWTSRGFAVLDVNYGGSTGYGRAYRDRLQGQWGIVDVDDCTTGALHLADRGLVDRARLAIRGGSAGGYTTLAALTFRDVFAAGASHYGIGDLGALARDTHKFEARYLDGLVGRYPQDEAVYHARSPRFHAEQIESALILLQGRDDLVVPPDQAQAMADAVRANGRPVALLMFDGEGHGFRQAPNIVRSIEAELWFYGRVFGFVPAGDIAPIEVDNLE